LTSTLEELNNRKSELEMIFKNLYEDRIKKIINENDFSILITSYRDEFSKIQTSIEVAEKNLLKAKNENLNINKLVVALKKYAYFTELDKTMLNELVYRIEVHKLAKDSNGKKLHLVDIYLKGAERINISNLDFI
jgi:hypothetical protein